jgi:hypothetical protein
LFSVKFFVVKIKSSFTLINSCFSFVQSQPCSFFGPIKCSFYISVWQYVSFSRLKFQKISNKMLHIIINTVSPLINFWHLRLTNKKEKSSQYFWFEHYNTIVMMVVYDKTSSQKTLSRQADSMVHLHNRYICNRKILC